jgi:hypothetical protein
MANYKNKPDHGPRQKAPGYHEDAERDTGHDPSIDDPDPGSSPIRDPDTEGAMGQPEDDDAPDSGSTDPS